MKILVFGPYGINPPHFEIELEIIQNHLDQGDEVVFLGCNSEVLSCDRNARHKFVPCLQCISKRTAGLSLLSKNIRAQSFLNLTIDNQKELPLLKTEFSTITELKEYRIENFDIGYAVLSSVVTITRDPEPNLQRYAGLVKNLIISSLVVYRSMQNQLDILKIDKTYIFNGRLALVRAALRACQSRNVAFATHETGFGPNHYSTYENTTPHDLDYAEKEIRQFWTLASENPHRDEIAAEFFLEKRNKHTAGQKSYIDGQQDGLLPRDWDINRRNIVIFTSSEDEFVAIGDEWKSPLYGTQYDGLEKILQSVPDSLRNIHLYHRMHPHLRGVKNEYTTRMSGLRRNCLTVIPPDDPVSTYALMDRADKILTFGSTTGIEAVYWGKPSVLAGQSYYKNLGGTYNPTSHEELMNLLRADLLPKEKEPALMYGYYMKTFGNAFRLVRRTGIYEAEFKSRNIQPANWVSVIVWAAQKHWRLEALGNKLVRYWTGKKLGVKFTASEWS